MISEYNKDQKSLNLVEQTFEDKTFEADTKLAQGQNNRYKKVIVLNYTYVSAVVDISGIDIDYYLTTRYKQYST